MAGGDNAQTATSMAKSLISTSSVTYEIKPRNPRRFRAGRDCLVKSRSFPDFLQPKCTQSCAVSMDDFAKRDFPMRDSDADMAADDASRMISSVIVKQGG